MKYLVPIVLCLLILGCGETQNHKSPINLDANPKISKILAEFCEIENCQNCLKELFIDRINPDSTIFTVRVRGYMSEYRAEPPPFFTFNINGNIFYVYTGAEKYLKPDSTFKSYIEREKKCVESIWTIFEKNGNYVIDKHGNEPYVYFPDSLIVKNPKFLPPDGKVGY
jgi:hypothetical protein